MSKEIIITPEELYFLGGVMKAKYIDYAYISAMQDIQKNFSVYESTAKDGLVKKGLLDEDFSGNLEIIPQAEELLTPIFFGNFESSIDYCQILEGDSYQTTRFHFLAEKIVRVTQEDGFWHIAFCQEEDILKQIGDFLAEETISADSAEEKLQKEKVTEIIVMKSLDIGKKSIVKICFCCNGIGYMENDAEEIVYISRKKIMEEAKSILLEG